MKWNNIYQLQTLGSLTCLSFIEMKLCMDLVILYSYIFKWVFSLLTVGHTWFDQQQGRSSDSVLCFAQYRDCYSHSHKPHCFGYSHLMNKASTNYKMIISIYFPIIMKIKKVTCAAVHVHLKTVILLL